VIEILLLICIARVPAQVSTPVAVDIYDRIGQLHLEGLLRKHHLAFDVMGGLRTCYLVDGGKVDVVSLLNSEAPPSSFSLFIAGKRELSDNSREWHTITREQLVGRQTSNIPIAQVCRLAKLASQQISGARYVQCNYIGTDGSRHTGYDIEVLSKSVVYRVQVLGERGAQRAVLCSHWPVFNLPSEPRYGYR